MVEKYIDLLLVEADDTPFIVCSAPHVAEPGDLVMFSEWNITKIGTVQERMYVEENGSEYRFVEKLYPICPAEHVWNSGWAADDSGQ